MLTLADVDVVCDFCGIEFICSGHGNVALVRCPIFPVHI